MKKIFTLAVAILATAGISAMAQHQCPDCQHGAAKAPQNKMYQPQQMTDFLFEGILLDIPQQAKVDSINTAYRAQPAQRPEGRPAQRPQGHHMQGNHGMMPGAQLMPGVKYVAALKEVLTPEQFDTFISNISSIPTPQAVPMQRAARCNEGAQTCPEGNAPAKCTKAGAPDCKKADCKKADGKDCKKADCKKADGKDCKKADCKKADGKDCKKADCKKGDCKDCKKDCKKADCKDCKKK